MRFGVCGNFKMTAAAAQASYDYAEWSVGNTLKPLESEEVFLASLKEMRDAALPYEVCNGFVPGELKITGPNVDSSALEKYVTTTMQRAEQAGVEVIVFGSGGARRIPDDFDRTIANDQLLTFCQMVGPIAQDHGVTIAIEPLNLAECNVLTTVDESAALVAKTAHPAIRLLVDGYHMMRDNDPYESIVRHGALLAHAHIATTQNRMAPGAEACDLSQFFDALSKANYTGRISIEGKIPAPETDLPVALSLMRKLAG